MASSSLRIGLIAPSCGGFTTEALQDIATSLLAHGLELVHPHDIIDKAYHPYAQSYDYRLASLINALHDDSITHIWAVRGGYGCYQLMHDLKRHIPSLKMKQPKTLIGYSDICSLGMYFTQCLNWSWIHSPNLLQYERAGNELLAMIKKAGTNENFFCANLTILQCSIGTYYQPNLAGKTVILEDHNEAIYRYERSIYHLLNSGMLNDVAEVMLADFGALAPETDADIIQFKARMNDLLSAHGIHCSSTTGIGHGEINKPVHINYNLK